METPGVRRVFRKREYPPYAFVERMLAPSSDD